MIGCTCSSQASMAAGTDTTAVVTVPAAIEACELQVHPITAVVSGGLTSRSV
ncbi:hypothetical protein MAHJHV29_49960 [Mycobacterium avium subsp. hominissuis]